MSHRRIGTESLVPDNCCAIIFKVAVFPVPGPALMPSMYNVIGIARTVVSIHAAQLSVLKSDQISM